jgi:colicin import membrane protein
MSLSLARKLKTYQTSVGFFDMAIAAPSMKAALEAWGSGSNLFHQGVAKEVDDPEVVAATMSKPGVILKRAVGSNQPFKEHADLPTHLPGDEVKRRPEKHRTKVNQQPTGKIDDRAARLAALAFDKARSQRAKERRKEEAARAKQRERREQAVATAQAALDKAKGEHDTRASTIEAERSALEKRLEAEEARWEKQKQKLESAVRRARE